ncbi:aminoglycoside phosphotransferase family protein [Eubacteriales bacterium OttesenSCG-928-G02]|nr:aminoglycoside phosphotransferase family protein [Eubacteriales bacterium OttesenSCG-928-G02]
MDESVIKNVCRHYDLKGEYLSYGIIKDGNINQTFVVDMVCDCENGKKVKSYLLQCINNYVFTEPDKLIENIVGITKHIASKYTNVDDAKRRTLKVYKTLDGLGYYCDEKGNFWRVLNYIYDAVTCNKADKLIMEKTGKAFGEFQALLSDYPTERMYIPIIDFHNTEKRLKALIKSAEEDKFNRLSELKDDYEYLISLEKYAHFFEDEYNKGNIPIRVTHNDTKCNNIMFDAHTMEPLAVIDLDTVMPGFAAHDFGDAVRFGASTVDEDEEDLSKVELDMELYEAFCKGYVSQVKSYLTPYEVKTLPLGAIAITYELSMRFMTDYLDGDKYFITRKKRHNYFRARCQTKLLKDIIAKKSEMERVIDKING